MEKLTPHRPQAFAGHAWDLRKCEWDSGSLLLMLQAIAPSGTLSDLQAVHVYFREVCCTRSLDEGYRVAQLDRWWNGQKPPGVVFQVEDSYFATEVAALGGGAREDLANLAHYIVLSANECVDILTACEPEVWTHETA